MDFILSDEKAYDTKRSNICHKSPTALTSTLLKFYNVH